MTNVDWNLIPALIALLDEVSVTGAAARLGVTVPTMSRILARLRELYADPLLVRAGRTLVPTEFATALKPRLAELGLCADAVLTNAGQVLSATPRTLVVRANDGVVGLWLKPMLAELEARAPTMRLAFVAEGAETPDELRDGRVDLDIGVLGSAAPELQTQVLLRDRFVAVVRQGHPWMRSRRSAPKLCAYPHLGISRKARFDGPIDLALKAQGLTRRVVATVPSATAAAIAVLDSDLIAAMSRVFATAFARTLPIAVVELPLELPPVVIAQTWHPRSNRDPVHALLRAQVASTIKQFTARRAPRNSR